MAGSAESLHDCVSSLAADFPASRVLLQVDDPSCRKLSVTTLIAVSPRLT